MQEVRKTFVREEEVMDPQGLARLHRAVQFGHAVSLAPYDEDAPVRDDLEGNELASIDLRDVELGWEDGHSFRSRVRYLAALFPDRPTRDLPELIAAVVGSSHLSVSDIRLVLQGRRLSDPSQRTREIPIETIQLIGTCLARGLSRTATARTVGVSVDTVEAIDGYLGLTEKRRQRLVEAGCDAVRDGLSVRRFAARIGEPVTNAHRILKTARAVLVEIGEVA